MIRKTKKPNYSITEIDEIFYELYKFYPNKRGQSYELLVGAILKILYVDKKIVWDKRKKGIYDDNNYQIDISIYGLDNEDIMVEAKDHTKLKAKTTRPELDKIAGSLIELNFSSGYFFSATDYTRDAKKKSIGSYKNPNAKSISLYHLREALPEDEKNRLKTIHWTISVVEINKINICPNLKPEDIQNLVPGFQGKMTFNTRVIFKYNINEVEAYGEFFDDQKIKIGHYNFKKILEEDLIDIGIKNDYHIKGVWDVDHSFIELHGKTSNFKEVKFDISFTNHSEEFEISAAGNPKLLVKCEMNGIDKLITDNQLKGVTFKDDGEIIFNNARP